MSMCTMVELDHGEADMIEANLSEFTTLLLRYLRTGHPVLADELCDRFRFRCTPAFTDATYRCVVVGSTQYLFGGGPWPANMPAGTVLDDEHEDDE